MNTQDVLKAKYLHIQQDPVSGHLRSKDGRRTDPNQQLAVALSIDYARFEKMFVRLRQIAATDAFAGLIQYNDTQLTPNLLLMQVQALAQSGIIKRYASYSSGIFVQLNPETREFLTKRFAQLHTVSFIKDHFHPEEIYYDVHLGEARGFDNYVVDVIYRQGSSVKFVLIALNPKLDQMPQQMERLVRTANRLRSSMTVVVSPGINVRDFSIRFNNMTDSRTDIVNVIPFNHLEFLL